MQYTEASEFNTRIISDIEIVSSRRTLSQSPTTGQGFEKPTTADTDEENDLINEHNDIMTFSDTISCGILNIRAQIVILFM